MKANSIEYYRNKKKPKVSQTKLGKALGGLAFQTISGFENGDPVADEYWPMMAAALGTTVENLKAPPPITYGDSSEPPPKLQEVPAPDWLEFVEWLMEEVPLETLLRKQEEAFREKWDSFDDWLKILARRKRDRQIPNQPRNQNERSTH